MSARFDALGIVVSDLDASLAFYRKLGLEFPDDPEVEGHIEAVLPGGTRLMLDTEEVMASFDPDFEAPTGAGRISLAFGCDDPGAVDALHDELVAAGHTSLRPPFDAFWGQRYATVLDPDGNSVDLFAGLAGQG
jgi:catechol 2,3-dioxygenase-like lactoylglutathione lyase family enzyme